MRTTECNPKLNFGCSPRAQSRAKRQLTQQRSRDPLSHPENRILTEQRLWQLTPTRLP
jgi:hypothetical protein